MNTTGPLSWKTLSCSAFIHGSLVAAVGLVLFQQPHVSVQESTVTAEFQVLENPSASAESLSSKVATKSSPIPVQEALPNPIHEVLIDEDMSTASPLEPVPKATPVLDALPASLHPASPAPTADRPQPHSVRSAHHTTSVNKRGAKNYLPDYLNNPPPSYPERSRLAGEQGIAVVRIVVDSSGFVSRLSLESSSGHPLLDRAALEAVSKWKFRPASVAGLPMESEITIPVRFELH